MPEPVQKGFLLTKWYLDCVSDQGTVLIAYAAHLRWKVMSLWYSGFFLHENGMPMHSNFTLKRDSFPTAKGPAVSWSSEALNLEGAWENLSIPIEKQLYEKHDGVIQWSCLQPRSKCSIQIEKKRRLEGLGYVERMTLSIPPWQLPISELRWGRFLTASDALVWIDWKGAVPLSLLFVNGSQIADCRITDEQISGDDGNLIVSLQDRTVLREGPLLSTALSIIPGAGRIFPVKILDAHECKWKSRGYMNSQGMEKTSGWAIHERVKF